ncbi:MAG: hypothetical protein GF311_23170 [Candidatus Lokiarchaeota archaeon]|nr:hypothetical protein [Candidatus Lokiarchaeota archaeon]
MYLFDESKEAEVSIKCKLCLAEIKFKITRDEYQNTNKFPIIKESVHGDPKHKLVVQINKNLEIDNFEIQDIQETPTGEISQELTKQVLHDLGLNDEEIELYLSITGRDVVSLGEIAVIMEKPKAECKNIANKFVEKGLFKEIIGATPHYSPLPPYAALLGQLRNFHEFISTVKDTLPSEVDRSFSEFKTTAKDKAKIKEAEDIIQDIKENMISEVAKQKEGIPSKVDASKVELKGISKEISDLETYARNIMEDQVDEMKKQFESINNKSVQIIQTQVDDLKDELNNMKTIISDNLRKLRLGVVQQTVNQLVEKVVSSRIREIQDGLNVQLSVNEMVFSDELNEAIEKLNKDFVEKFKSSIEEALTGLEGIEVDTDVDQKKIFENLGNQFQKAVKIAEEKINTIYSDVFDSIGDFKGLFTKQVVNTIDDTLDEILDRLEMQEAMTQQFWDQAKRRSTITMQDIWFIRSPEAAKAHINEEVSRAKLRTLIVAPQITDIDLNAIKSAPKHVNIRIATNIDLSNPEHKRMVDELETIGNVDYRKRGLQNIWGINRDYEEVVLCVLSEIEVQGKKRTEIAGIGSIIEEHIKIFVPILEDAWVGAQKEISYSVNSASEIKPEEKEVSREKPKTEVAPKVEPQTEKPIEIKPMEKPKMDEYQVSEEKEEAPEKPIEPPKEVPAEEKAEPSDVADLETQLKHILSSVDKLPGDQIADKLQTFHNTYVKNVGYNTTMKTIYHKITGLKAVNRELTDIEKRDLKMKVREWKDKLSI